MGGVGVGERRDRRGLTGGDEWREWEVGSLERRRWEMGRKRSLKEWLRDLRKMDESGNGSGNVNGIGIEIGNGNERVMGNVSGNVDGCGERW